MTKQHTAILCLLLLCLPLLQAAGGAVVFGVVPAGESAGQGVVVRRVAEHTPAHAAGLMAGDVIESVQGTPTPQAAALKEVLSAYAPGDVVRVRYRRSGELRTTLVELAARPEPVSVEAKPVAEVELTPEVQLQFAQARSRLRIQLARLPHRMNTQQVQADLMELLTLARSVPSGCTTWLQGQDVQLSLSLDYPGGAVELRCCNGDLFLAVQDPASSEPVVYPINTPAERAALPHDLVQRLRQR